MALNISNPFANKAELRVEIGKTSVEELAKFQEKAEAKGGGQLRAKQNKDGSFTLYVSADKKLRLAGNGQRAREARGAKLDLAKNLVKDILSRRLPAGGSTPALLKKINDGRALTVTGLATSLSHVSTSTTQGVSQRALAHYTAKFQDLDQALKQPGLRALLGETMNSSYVGENFDFECRMMDFHACKSPTDKLQLAEGIFHDFIESSEANPETIKLNLSSVQSQQILSDIQILRADVAQNGTISEGNYNKLNQLFDDAQLSVRTNFVGNDSADVVLGNLANTDAFKQELSRIIATTANTSRDELNPARVLPPGSGEELQQAMSLENVLGDSGLRESLRSHLSSVGKQADLQRYEALENCAKLEKNPSTSEQGLLGLLEKLAPSDRKGQKILQEPQRDDFAGRIQYLQQQDSIFGTGDLSPSDLRKAVQSLIADMQTDAGNTLRPSLSGIREAVIDHLAHQKLEWQADREKHYGDFQQFVGQELVGSGGATGSGRARIGKQFYQVKDSIEHAGLLRRLKAGGLNHENYGEVISSNIARALRGAQDRQLIPEVSLRQNESTQEAVVTSRYLSGGQGDLDDHYRSLVGGPLPKGQKHCKVELGSSAPSGGGVLRLSGQAARDVQTNIALSALMGDHDVNPGNMIFAKGERVGRIDFGHAFNELIAGPKLFGGGGVRNTDNRILDFFNRESVSGNPLVSGQSDPKLWRDYTGAGHSAGMTQALRDVASSTEALDGLVQAKTQFVDLLAELDSRGTPQAKKEIEDITQSLAKISKNIGAPIDATKPDDVVREVFQKLDAFVRDGQTQMRQVADLSELQTRIDDFIKQSDGGAKIPDEIQTAYDQLTDSSVKSSTGLTWMKTARDIPAFEGDLQSYIDKRRSGEL